MEMHLTEIPITQKERSVLQRLFGKVDVRKSPVADVPDLQDVRETALRDELNRIEAAKSAGSDDNSILDSAFPFMRSANRPAQPQVEQKQAALNSDPNSCFDGMLPIGKLPAIAEI